MAVTTETELREEISRLRAERDSQREEITRLLAELDRQRRESDHKEAQLERYAADLRETFKEERARSAELHSSYMATVRALSNAVEARDAYTSKHAERVTAYGIEVARAVGLDCEGHALEFGFLLHDIGKVGVPDAILYKPARLTEKERQLMAQHPLIGAEIVRDIEFLGDATDVVRFHHERWDGTGYPEGLAGEEIPLPARVFAVADVLDALTSDRPYRPASTLAVARDHIVAGSGGHFDPDVVAAFETIPDAVFERIAREML